MEKREVKALKLARAIAEARQRNVLFRLVLVRLPDGRLYIYYGDIVFSDLSLKEKPENVYKKGGLEVWLLPSKKEEAFDFIQNLIHGSGSDTPNIDPKLHETGQFVQFTVFGKLQIYETEFMETYSQTAEKYNLQFPCKTYPLSLEQTNFKEWSLPYHRSMSDLIADTLNIRGLDDTYIRYKFNVHFEISAGRLYNLRFDGSSIKVDVEMKHEKDKYQAVVMLDKAGGNTEYIRISDVPEHIEKHFPPNTVERVEARLIYNDELIDKVFEYKAIDDKDKKLPYVRKIKDFKEQVTSIKSQIKTPKSLEFCALVDSRLLDAETKLEQDPKDVLQSLQDAMEYLCGDFFKALEESKDGIGLGLHTKLVDLWKRRTKRNLTELKYQTGVRHIIRLGASKEHEGYEPYREEVEYLLLIAWRGYWEILRMLKEVQELRPDI